VLPLRLTRRYSQLRRRARKIDRLFGRERRHMGSDPAAGAFTPQMVTVDWQLERHFAANWLEICNFFRPVEKPAGLDTFLEEMGL
jgi:hypothetical protein